MNDFFNKEQLLELCLLKQSTQDFLMEGPTAEFIMLYIISSFGSKGSTEEEINEKFNIMRTEYELKALVDKGYLEADLTGNDVTYWRTTKGRKAQNARV